MVTIPSAVKRRRLPVGSSSNSVHVTTDAYTPAGFFESTTDPSGVVTEDVDDNLGRLRQEIDDCTRGETR
jgi:hypothetical protein